MVDSPFSSSLPHYHSYYQFQSPGIFVLVLVTNPFSYFAPQGTHDHELKRQYLSLLPPKQIIEICLAFDVYVPPYAKTAVWPLDLNAAIAGLQRNASSSLSETAKNASVNTKPSEAQEACTSERESAKTGEPPPTDNQAAASASERSTAPQLSPSEIPNPQKPSNTESQETQVASAPTAQSQHAPSVPNPVYPQTPFGYGHVQVAYPHAPYYASGYPYPYPYPPQVPNGQTSPPAPTLFPPHPASYSSVFPPHQPEASGNDDLPSYEEMIVEALSECTDPDGWVPKDLFTWMAARYPLQSNFRPSASQALQKAYKRGRFEKGTNGKYRLSASWEGGSVSLLIVRMSVVTKDKICRHPDGRLDVHKLKTMHRAALPIEHLHLHSRMHLSSTTITPLTVIILVNRPIQCLLTDIQDIQAILINLLHQILMRLGQVLQLLTKELTQVPPQAIQRWPTKLHRASSKRSTLVAF